jgi:hypothetical protein
MAQGIRVWSRPAGEVHSASHPSQATDRLSPRSCQFPPQQSLEVRRSPNRQRCRCPCAERTRSGTARTLTVLPDGQVLGEGAAPKVRAGERGHGHVEDRLVALGAFPRRGRSGVAAESDLGDIGALVAGSGVLVLVEVDGRGPVVSGSVGAVMPTCSISAAGWCAVTL